MHIELMTASGIPMESGAAWSGESFDAAVTRMYNRTPIGRSAGARSQLTDKKPLGFGKWQLWFTSENGNLTMVLAQVRNAPHRVA